MLKIAAAVLLSIPVALLGVLAATGLVVVDVKPADGPRIFVPVPLILARAALGFAPVEARQVEVPELSQYSELGSRLVEELRDAPDGILVEVEGRDEHVVIEKVGDELAIEVHSDDEEVSVRLPLSLAAEIFESHDGGTIETSKILAALSSASATELVHVKSRDEEVRVRIW